MDNNIIYSPFNLEISEMESLALINIEKDPDKVYKGFEPQSINNKEFGLVLRILGYRNDGYVDVYQEKKLPRDEKDKIEVAGKGLGDFIYLNMEKNRFIIDEHGVDLELIFIDKLERRIVLKIKEHDSKKINPFSLLAPVGVSSVNPVSLPVFFLYGFYFIRQKNTDVNIQIEDKIHNLDKFIRMDGSKMYFARYSKESVICEWNKATNSFIEGMKVENNRCISRNGVEYKLESVKDDYYIKSMKLDGKRGGVNVKFSPSIKDIRHIEDGEKIEGSFIISGDKSVGIIEGMYSLYCKEKLIRIIAIPNRGWIPNEKRIILRFIYFATRIFKMWPKTYKWIANIDIRDNENPKIQSKWERIKHRNR